METLFPSDWINAFDTASPSLQITENDNCFSVNVIAPGFLKDDFTVNIEDDILTITAVAHVNSQHNFTRSFRLPGNVQQHLITAVYKNELLSLHLPKNTETGKKAVPVE